MTDTRSADLSLAEIGQRIELNKQSGWGLERGTSAQLNLLALYCQKHRLLPGDDVTLYEGRPWITIDGRVKLMRRHTEYRGYATRPLSKDEKVEWGYDPEDLVVEATVRTTTYGEIKARGRVSKAERTGSGAGRLNPVARTHPVEMAEKRALSRAERLTFGTDAVVDDEDLLEAAAEPLQDRVRIRENAATHARIFDAQEESLRPAPAARRQRPLEELVARYQQAVQEAADEGWIPPEDLEQWVLPADATREQVLEQGLRVADLKRLATAVRVGDPLADELAGLIEEAAALEVPYDDCKVVMPASKEAVEQALSTLRARVAEVEVPF